MPETEQVQTATDTEESPPETSDSVPSEETGREEATPEETVGAEEAWTPEMGFHKHPDWIKRDEETADKVREAEDRAVAAEARAETHRHQLQQTQTAPAPTTEPTREEMRRRLDEGDIEQVDYTDYVAREEARLAQETAEQGRIATESNQRAMKMVSDLNVPGTEGNTAFIETSMLPEYVGLFDTRGQPLVYNAYEIVAKETRRVLDARRQETNAKTNEAQRVRAIESQGAGAEVPHGRGAEDEMTDPRSQLSPREKDHLRKSGRLDSDEEVKTYVSNRERGVTSTTPTRFPEKARLKK